MSKHLDPKSPNPKHPSIPCPAARIVERRRMGHNGRMKPILHVYALPKFSDPKELAGGTAVVIDVLRAATTIVHALAAGADEVAPCLEVADALALAEKYPADEVVLGGERHGLPIDGFQLGNSPEDYVPEQVAGKTVIFTTTNGTRAMMHAQQADEILVASFVNVSAVARRLFDRERVHIICAGTDGNITEEDVLLAGLLVERLQREGGMVYQQNAQAMTARETWMGAFAVPQAIGAEPIEPEKLAERLAQSVGGRNLVELGLVADILAASRIDRFDLVPRLDPKTFRIRAV